MASRISLSATAGDRWRLPSGVPHNIFALGGGGWRGERRERLARRSSKVSDGGTK